MTSEPTSQKSETGAPAAPEGQGAKLLIEMAPLVLFFATYMFFGLKPATGVLMVATVASTLASWLKFGHVAPMLIVTTVLVLGFGAMTFLLDERFIKMKPTAVNLLFAGALGFGLTTGRNFLKAVLGEALKLTDTGWSKLTVRWIVFFVVLAVINEVVWRGASESAWVTFKTFGILPLTILFMIAQVGLIKQHALPSADQT